MGEGQRLGLGKRTLAGYRPRSIYIDEQRGLPCSIRQAAWGCKRLAIEQILLKERTQCFHGGLIEGSKKAGKCRAMGQEVATKEGHEKARQMARAVRKKPGAWVLPKAHSR